MIYGRCLFGIAAILNFSVAGLMLLGPSWTMAMLGLDITAGFNSFFVYFTDAMITLFGYCYLRIAINPHSYRVLIPVGVVGKLFAEGSALWSWFEGTAPARLPAVMSLDVLFALLFLDYLWRSRVKR
jgi:hypothetical protein